MSIQILVPEKRIAGFEKYKMIMNRPASWWDDNWREGLPLGNGLHGALVYGQAANERIMLTHTNLWREGRQPNMPDVSHVLQKMRDLIFANKIPEADKLIFEELNKKGYNPFTGYSFPAADLYIKTPAKEGFSRYKRELLMDKAEAIVEYFDGEDYFCRRVFVSRKDDVIVVEANAGVEVDLTYHATDTVKSNVISYPQNQVVVKDGEWIFFKSEIDGKEHGAVARVVRGARTLIICKLYTEGNSEIKWQDIKKYISTLPIEYNKLLERHIPLHQRLFNKCEFKLEDEIYTSNEVNRTLLDAAYNEGLPNALVERMWAYGRYLLVTSTTTGGLPCALTGLWSGEYRASWAFNMANINLEMIYWQALPGMLTELMLPVFDYYEKHMDDMRMNAKNLYGCKGIYLPAVSSPGGLKLSCMAPHIINWTAGAGWIAQLYYDYYIFTRDLEFLTNRALPFMTEAAKFYMDFVVWQGDKWHVCPSISPENHTRGDGSQSSIDATMDIAVIKELFMHLIELGKSTNLISPHEMINYQKMLDGAIGYQYNEFETPREWLHENFQDNDLHRHQSHLFPVFPGLELARSNEKTLEAYRQGGLRRLTVGLSHQTSWSLTQNANLMARVGDGENALKCLSLIARSTLMENLFTVHNDWRGMGICLEMPSAPFQIDANMGWTAAVQEMLLFSDTNRIDILPALPKKWLKGRIGPLATRTGVNVTIVWDKKSNIGSVELTAVRNTKFLLHLPNKKFKKLVQKEGETYTMSISF
jgi:alpha-L-fucosidase 2